MVLTVLPPCESAPLPVAEGSSKFKRDEIKNRRDYQDYYKQCNQNIY